MNSNAPENLGMFWFPIQIELLFYNYWLFFLNPLFILNNNYDTRLKPVFNVGPASGYI